MPGGPVHSDASAAEASVPGIPGPEPDGAPPAGDGIDPGERTPRSFHLSRSLLERARAAAYWVAQLPDRDEPTNVSELVERALSGEVERLERTYNNGVPFPAVVGRMRTGPGASGVERIRRAQRARRRPAPATGTADPNHDPSPPADAVRPGPAGAAETGYRPGPGVSVPGAG